MAGLLALGLSRQRIVVVLAMTCLAVLAWRMYLAGFAGFQPERTYYSSDTRVDSIVFGCLLALAANPRDEKPERRTRFCSRCRRYFWQPPQLS
jgi:peptidoglycan/LPS O-acetylase OafA/YrhL